MDDVSPQAFIDAVMAFQKTAAVKAAVALDLFTAIANENGGCAGASPLEDECSRSSSFPTTIAYRHPSPLRSPS